MPNLLCLSCCPCLLLEVVGSSLFVNGACFGEERVLVDPLCPPVLMTNSYHWRGNEDVARVFSRIRTCVSNLQKHYRGLTVPPFTVRYLNRLAPNSQKPVFLAQEATTKARLVVKFTDHGKENASKQAEVALLKAMGIFHSHDFDWAGPAGTALYPEFMNHCGIEWPKGAEDRMPITKEHDHHWLMNLFNSRCCGPYTRQFWVPLFCSELGFPVALKTVLC
ncbi:hypothetical protein Pelo_10727 [Pelomyxa schiedti]|nr:hypothetical protein Pelo_10727 [Pelomyxa schiedti]